MKQERLPRENELSEQQELAESVSFDLTLFFDQPADNTSPETAGPELLTTLQADSHHLVTSVASKLTAETFNTTARFITGASSLISSLAGSCGVLCAHGLGSVVQASGSLAGGGLAGSGITGSVGWLAPGLSVDQHGNVNLKTNLQSLSHMSGLSRADLLSGRYSALDILSAVLATFGHGVYCAFGFGLIEGLLNQVLTPEAA